MKITFWSPVHGQARTTANMIAVAVYSTLMYDQNNMIMQTHFNLNNLEIPFIGTQTKVVGEYFNGDVGIDALARSIKSAPLDKEIIHNCSFSLLEQQLNLLPGTTKANREHYEANIQPVITGIMSALEKNYDIVFTDTNSGLNDALTNRILDNSDLIIVNLCQNKGVLDGYFELAPFDNKKVFYLIGNYDKNSCYNKTNLKRMYKALKKDNLAVIPYNTGYMDAQSNGSVIDYIKQCMDSKKNDTNKYFIDTVKDTTVKIIKMAGLNRRPIE